MRNGNLVFGQRLTFQDISKKVITADQFISLCRHLSTLFHILKNNFKNEMKFLILTETNQQI